MEDREVNKKSIHSTRETTIMAMKQLVGLLLKEIGTYGSIAHRFRDDTDDGYHYIELDLKPEIEGEEFDLSVNGDRALIRFVRKVKETV